MNKETSASNVEQDNILDTDSSHLRHDRRPHIENMDTTGVRDGRVGTANTASSVDGGMGNTTTGDIATNADMSFGQNIVHGDQNVFGPLNINPSGNSETTAGETVEPEDWFERVPISRKDEQVTEKDLGRMVAALGKGWEFVAFELDLSQVQIDHSTMSTSGHLQMLPVFIKWRQKKGRRATFNAFVEALKACEDRCTIDWEKIEGVVKANDRP